MRNKLLLSCLCGVALLSIAAPARAQERGYYCDDSGYRCIRVQHTDDWSGERHGRTRYDRDYDGDRHQVCDSDGDRCYESRGWRWDYREYYRRHGYHWND